MISAELLAKAHSALGVTKESAPCSAALRELVEAVEAHQDLFPSAIPVSVTPAPQLIYATDEHQLFWDVRRGPDVEMLHSMCTRLELRMVLALAEHVVAQLREALGTQG